MNKTVMNKTVSFPVVKGALLLTLIASQAHAGLWDESRDLSNTAHLAVKNYVDLGDKSTETTTLIKNETWAVNKITFTGTTQPDGKGTPCQVDVQQGRTSLKDRGQWLSTNVSITAGQQKVELAFESPDSMAIKAKPKYLKVSTLTYNWNSKDSSGGSPEGNFAVGFVKTSFHYFTGGIFLSKSRQDLIIRTDGYSEVQSIQANVDNSSEHHFPGSVVCYMPKKEEKK